MPVLLAIWLLPHTVKYCCCSLHVLWRIPAHVFKLGIYFYRLYPVQRARRYYIVLWFELLCGNLSEKIEKPNNSFIMSTCEIKSCSCSAMIFRFRLFHPLHAGKSAILSVWGEIDGTFEEMVNEAVYIDIKVLHVKEFMEPPNTFVPVHLSYMRRHHDQIGTPYSIDQSH